MASTNLKSGVSVSRTLVDMNLDIWHLILDQIDSQKDLYNVCLTSRAWFAMAIPHLYKVVPLMLRPVKFPWEDREDMSFARSLSRRLLDTDNEQLRNAVRELDFGEFEDYDLEKMEKRLVALVDCLPNLETVKVRSQLTQEVLRAITGHSKRISLHLLNEDGKRSIEGDYDFRNVVALAATVDPFDEEDGPNRDVLGIQKLLFACQNLTSFSLEEAGWYGGCVIGVRPRFESVHSFQFSGDETFPPLEELSLSGYRPRGAERDHWRNKLQWSKLRSLTLGPQYTATFLDLAAGYAQSLRNLEVKVYTDADQKTNCPPLEQFLMSFSSLESLSVRGYHLPVETIKNHPGLKHLCLHSFESVEKEISRPTLDIDQLQELDKSCAYLEILEIDLSRDGKWPEQILKTLATGFRNLQRLILHLEVGIEDVKECTFIEPILSEDSARDVGQQFFKWRSSSKLSTLVLKTGEPLRRDPQWEPDSSCFERRNAETMEVSNPWNTGGVPEVSVMQKSFYDYL
ncbi:hypothetical protein F5Y10DRAFT_258622 [Nemania abortiva]|nr:hypothetical protein F5Y10DRAFT_258622 [Nemania abortiva]